MESEDIQKSDEINLCNRGLTATVGITALWTKDPDDPDDPNPMDPTDPSDPRTPTDSYELLRISYYSNAFVHI
jgi:hypothetical protein